MYPVIEWRDRQVVMLDQRLLPERELFVTHRTHQEVARSIKEMVIRGAPAIGVAAAMGIALGMQEAMASASAAEQDDDAWRRQRFNQVSQTIQATRPTAVNLFWAAQRMQERFTAHRGDYATLVEALIAEACALDRQDVEINRAIGRHGQALLPQNATILTHCNAGALATAGYGTALEVVRAAREAGKEIAVYADETRPYLQGARLTIWELQQDQIPVTLITDNMAGWVMQLGKIQAVIVGADRIAANGDTANKIGTYSVAVLAARHHIPFYVAAPLSTIDPDTPDGHAIPIEERDPDEVLNFRGQRIARPQTTVFNPSFDVTPAELIHAIITEHGILRPPFGPAIAGLPRRVRP